MGPLGTPLVEQIGGVVGANVNAVGQVGGAQRTEEQEGVWGQEASLHEAKRRAADGTAVALVLVALGEGARIGDEGVVEHLEGDGEG